MEGFLVAAMVLVFLVLVVLIFVGGRAWRPAATDEVSRLTASWPRVAVLVPVTGAAPGLKARLRALLSQDYPHYQVVFSTRDAQDPATAVILSLIRRDRRARHVVAGPARSCGQKNHNLLAALKLVGQTPEILVFCDSNQSAPPDWLKELVAPIVAGRVEVTSGYHQIIAPEPGIAAQGRAISVLTLYLTKGFRRLNQPWGGATAMRRRLFEDLEVARLWAENVVDDVSLAARLVRAGLPVGLSPGACLDTPIEDETLTRWSQWLSRQWLYLKFCMPVTWVAVGMMVHLHLILVLLAAACLLLAPLGLTPGVLALAAPLFLGGLTGLGLALRSYHPQPGPLGRWLVAYFAAMGMASWCHLQTWGSMEMRWRGMVYRVGWQGRVVEILSSEQSVARSQ
jgi:cellulose synthase/poly-beta-1,6-N-acetylglucosamine synthase-like glycosyltransferase